ncbi:MAG TPA: hypothetical protein VNT20_15720 [Flavisolibacter sp.]|nr:hypothetical protein [Flavisolibacter sp.]
MATIILNRTSEYINRLRDYLVYIDGKKVGTISNGEIKEFNVPSGQHSMVTKIDWCSSQTVTFDVSEDEVKNFNVGGFKNARWLMPTGLIIIVLSYFANLLFDIEYLFYLVIPSFLIMVYYMTVGRKRYLTLTEEKTKRQVKMALQ